MRNQKITRSSRHNKPINHELGRPGNEVKRVEEVSV